MLKIVPRIRGHAIPALVWLAASMLAAPALGQGAGLFSPLKPEAIRLVAATSPDQLTVRRRLVSIDFGMLASSRAAITTEAAPPATLGLNLFDDVELTAIVERTEPTSSGYVLIGRIRGVELGTMALVVNGPTVAGTVRTPGATYRIRTTGKGTYAISQVDLSKLPDGAEPVIAPPPQSKPTPVSR